MRKLFYCIAALAVVPLIYYATGLSRLSRPVKYVAYLGFNYLDVAKDSANSYNDSLHIVALQHYLDRINDGESSKLSGVKFQLKTFQCNFREDTIRQLYRSIVADTNIYCTTGLLKACSKTSSSTTWSVCGNVFKSFDFPFDQHELVIPISALTSSNKIKISFDYSRLQIRDKIKEFEMNDWDTEEYYVTLDNQITNALGSPNKVTFDPDDKGKHLEKYKTLNVHLRVSRQPWGAIILIVLPFLMFSALPIFMLFFHKASYEEVGELIITFFLATVAYSINLVQISPATDSMNLAYIFLMLTLGINFFCFLYVTYIARQCSSIPGAGEAVVKTRSGMYRLWMPHLLLVFLILLFYFIFNH